MLFRYKGIDDKHNELYDKKMILDSAKNDCLQKYREELPNVLTEKIQKISERLHQTERGKQLSELEINYLLRNRDNITKAVKYTADELSILFEYYQEALIAINRKQVFPPTKKNFCAFAGISSSTYDAYLRTADDDKREIMQMIDDYITDSTLTLAQNGKIKEITTMFRGKTEHGMIEATAPVVIEHKSTVDFNEINARIQAIKQAEKQKTIELKPNKNGVYEEMNE